MTTTTRPLFERIGGKPAVHAAVNAFYARVLADPLLAPFFETTDMLQQANKLKGFLTMAFGGPVQYSGKDLRAGHAHLVERGLDDQHFDAVMGHLTATLAGLKLDLDLIREVAAIGESTRNDVLGR